MRNPIATLFDTNQGKPLYVAKAVAISVLPATIISYLLYQINPSTITASVDLPLAAAITQLVIVAPVIETLLMWPIISTISRWTKDNLILTAFLSASLWSIFHGVFNLNWGLTILWPFFVFSITFCVWRSRSRLWALIMTASIHATQNFLAVVYLNTA